MDPVRALRDAVVTHLRELCATPRGSVLALPGYGIDDPARAFHEYPGSARDMELQLRESIVRFEPRLRDVCVTHVPSDELDLTLRFDIEGALVHEGRAIPVRFSTVIHANHHVELS
jgi:type VI secretion system protein